MIGQTISHYRITEKLGEGGMGVVYRAEDTKLERTVALKFLAEHLLSDTEAKQRFLREAKAAAALSHPNICTVHEIDEAQGKTFLAMEFVQGETLEDRIGKGPLPLKDALDIGRQLANGLEAAHEKGIVHRDIKPANVLIDAKGRATIMDFGLARLTEASRLTKADTTMGTVAYMSPEQVQGMEVDHRSDIWALGCVLYEMVRGQRPFQGQYDQALAYEIVHQEPEPLTGVRAGVPMELEFIVGKCLAKEADSRYRQAADLAVDLKTLQDKLRSGRSTVVKATAVQNSGPLSTGTGTRTWSQQPSTLQPGAFVVPIWKRSLPWAVATVLALALVIVAFLNFREAPPTELPLLRFTYVPPTTVPAVGLDSLRANLAVSLDGQHIAFVAGGSAITAFRETVNRQLWVRDRDQTEAHLIAEGAWLAAPFWSPDSDYLGFSIDTGDTLEVRKVSVRGGPSSRVCEFQGNYFFGGAWSPDGEVIVFAVGSGAGRTLYQVPAGGGTPEPVVLPGLSEDSADQPEPFWPHFLPGEAGSRVLVYADWPTPGLPSTAQATLLVYDLTTGRSEVLGPGAYPVYSPSGHLVYQANWNDYNLLAGPFSLQSLEFTEDPFPVKEDASYPSVSRDGTLVYLESRAALMKQMVWRDRRGAKLGTIGQPQQNLQFPELSPDGGRVLVRSTETGNFDIWLHDVVRGVKQRLTFDPAGEDRPIWLPGGDRINFSSARRSEGLQDIYVQSADGTGEPELLVGSPTEDYAFDWSADGKYMIFDQFHEKAYDLYYLERKNDGSGYDSLPFLTSPFDTRAPQFSPDSKYVAYESNESGTYEVYVQPFPEGGRKVQVTANGAGQPRWRGDGQELFYVEGDSLIAVPVTTESGFSTGTPQKLFEAAPGVLSAGRGPFYTVTPDGQKFILVEDADGDQATVPAIQVTQNWFAEFKDQQQD